MPDRPTYASNDLARGYLARLDAAFGIHIDRGPVERFMPWRGHEVHIDDWEATPPLKGTVVLIHGGGGNGRLLAPFAAPLADAGYRVVAPDLPAYGLTVPKPGWVPDYADWVELVADLAVQHAPEGPVFLYGLSVGGMTALRGAQRAPSAVAGVAVTTLIDMRDDAAIIRGARAAVMGRAFVLGFRRLPFLIDRVSLPLRLAMPLETLTTDPELAQMIVRDPLLGRNWVTGRLFRTMWSYRPPRDGYALDCPILLAHPGADAWTPAEISLEAFAKIPGEKTFVPLTNGAHAPLEAPAYQELNAAVLGFFGEITNRGQQRSQPASS